MPRKDHIDAFGAVSLVCFALLLAYNQVVIKVVNEGLQPVFFAGIRSLGAALCVGLWMRARGIRLTLSAPVVGAGLLMGAVFATEFLLLFIALDHTSVTRSSVIFYSMPLWLSLFAHVLLPGEALSRGRLAGLALAFAGVVWAILHRPAGGEASLLGDLCALGAALGWAGVALVARGTALARVTPEEQLFWQVSVSAPILLALSPLFGPLVRDLAPIHLWGLAFQIVVVVSAAFLFWFWLLKRYPASGVASFSFLSPVFGAVLGWALLGEHMGPGLMGALALVAAGLVLINRPARRAQVPQKV